MIGLDWIGFGLGFGLGEYPKNGIIDDGKVMVAHCGSGLGRRCSV